MSQKYEKIKQFHYTHGNDVSIYHHLNQARRTQTNTNGLVFTSKPIEIDQKIAIKLLRVSDELPAVISIGFTSHDPKSLDHDIPTSTRSALKRRTGFWMCSLSKQACAENRVLFFYVNSTGSIKYGTDGEEKGTFEKQVDTGGQLWGLIDIWSPPTTIRLCGYKIKSTMFHQFRSRNLKISENYLHKTYKKRRTSYAFTSRPLQVNEMIKIKFSDSGSFALGLTSCDPGSLRHRYLTENVRSLLDRPEYWVVVDDSSWYFKHNEEISYMITNYGELKIWQNNSLLRAIHVDQSQPLWGFFALCSIRSLEVTSFITNQIEPSAPQLEQDEMPSCSHDTRKAIQVNVAPSGDSSKTSTGDLQEGENSNDSLCVVCCDNISETALVPCGHMCMCFGCAQKQWRGGGDGLCPMCRAKIMSVLRVYKS